MRFIYFLFFTVMMLAGPMAKADVFVWEDPAFDFQLTYPDDWVAGVADRPNVRYKVAGDGAHHVVCRYLADRDERYVIYPNRYLPDVRDDAIQPDYWANALPRADSITLVNEYTGGVGAGPAYYALLDYRRPVSDGSMAAMRAISAATIYDDIRFQVICEASKRYFADYRDLFGAMMDSIAFEPKYHPFKQGFYRDFFR